MADLNREKFADAACMATGLSDFGEASWQEGLDRLLDSLENEADLNDLGRTIVEGEVVGYLTNRLEILSYRKEHPEIAEADVVPPIVIVGQGRTGTTILHDLLAQDPATRVPLTWEVDAPVPPPETAMYHTDPRVAASDESLAMVDLVIPGFRSMHPMGAQLPQECVRITALDFKSMIHPTQYYVPSYARWLLNEADMSSAYRWHRIFLQHLQSKHPTDRWILKSPGHIWCLEALLAEYPDALLVQTHRDPLRIIASLGSLVSTLRSLASSNTSIPVAAGEFADYIIDGLDRSVDARENGIVSDDRVVDVYFDQFMADPFAVIAKIYAAAGFEYTADAEARMRAHLGDNPQDK
ncbi:MAG TPA: sulfotransferase, partial [Acidimicrobiia bacterium]|nr:sulfotransferase [Acidimicrobiia bacterium]